MVCDIRGKTIEVGAFIRYTGTGTISQVVELKDEDNQSWVKLKDTSLWYIADSLEVVNFDDLIDVEGIGKDTLDKVKDLKEGLDDLTESIADVQGCEGGG